MSEHDNDTCPHLVRASLLESENARLKNEVERLRKAWDAMADIDSCFDGNTPITQGVGSVFKIVKRWKDANKI